jgi:hypothetical protein
MSNRLHAVTGGRQVLEIPVGETRGFGDAFADFLGLMGFVDEARYPKCTGRDIGGGVGRQRRGVDRDGEAAILQQASRGETDNAAADDRGLSMWRCERELRRHIGGAPG